MKTKVIATDLDGTLLKGKYWISKKNLIYLKKFIDLGGIVCFITGRSLESTREIANIFEQKTGRKVHYLSCLKGSLLFDNINQKIIDINFINPDVSNRIFKLTKSHKCIFATYFENDLSNKNMFIYGANAIIKFLHFFNKFKNFKQIISNTNNIDSNCLKINIGNIFFNYRLKKLYKNIKNELITDVEISFTSYFMYEITKYGCNKGTAVKRISELLNIKLNQFAAFGDSENDLDIFKEVGLAISVNNRCKKLVHVANYVVSNKYSNGVARGIKKYILNN